MLPHCVLKHSSVTTLDPAVRWVLVALAGQYNGHNNGAISLGRAAAREYGVRSADTLFRALRVLCDRRLAEMIFPGSRVPPLPARYALTWLPVNATEWTSAVRTPSHAYRQADWSGKSGFDVRPPDINGSAHRTRKVPKGDGNGADASAHRTHLAKSRVRSADTSIPIPMGEPS